MVKEVNSVIYATTIKIIITTKEQEQNKKITCVQILGSSRPAQVSLDIVWQGSQYQGCGAVEKGVTATEAHDLVSKYHLRKEKKNV